MADPQASSTISTPVKPSAEWVWRVPSVAVPTSNPHIFQTSGRWEAGGQADAIRQQLEAIEGRIQELQGEKE